MTYSVDLRERAVKYVQEGGKQAAASTLFGIGRKTLYRWLQMEELQPRRKRAGYTRRLDKTALAAHVAANPDMILRERAVHFGVHINAIWVALKVLNISKKNDALQGNMSSK
jgi:putative transposase